MRERKKSLSHFAHCSHSHCVIVIVMSLFSSPSLPFTLLNTPVAMPTEGLCHCVCQDNLAMMQIPRLFYLWMLVPGHLKYSAGSLFCNKAIAVHASSFIYIQVIHIYTVIFLYAVEVNGDMQVYDLRGHGNLTCLVNVSACMLTNLCPSTQRTAIRIGLWELCCCVYVQ